MQGIIIAVIVDAFVVSNGLSYCTGEREGFRLHEVEAQQTALEVHKRSLATSERLRAEESEAAERDREDADSEIERIREAEAQAKAEAERVRAEAEAHAAAATTALELVDELEGQTCPVCPKPDPDAVCPWTCVLPDVPE